MLCSRSTLFRCSPFRMAHANSRLQQKQDAQVPLLYAFQFIYFRCVFVSVGQLPNNLVPLSACITKFKNQNSTSSTWCTTRRRSSRGHTVASWTTSSTRLPSSPTSSPSSSESSSSWGF
ncbi:uncharacterized protein LOC119365182 isoform X3 [Triticum dicoccoides]|uniref:uncharacterized protein LOC119365182 isoform X3 n=1 Tax=Triticum dicoccoides TaxID=85692 RepID=UPI0018906B3A|nr:uncharacterized protein LOC119365182 isoform X3 [Triticum dicoccoides]XP_044325537.1 uncharacterized protein LOC123046285 isoform X3 [Triticum aestivum]